MGPGGTGANRRFVEVGEGVITEAEPGCLTAYYRRLAATLDRMISLRDADVFDNDRRFGTRTERSPAIDGSNRDR
jgi:hypothetical protein